MVVPKFPKRSPKLILRTPLATAFWKTPIKKQMQMTKLTIIISTKEEHYLQHSHNYLKFN